MAIISHPTNTWLNNLFFFSFLLRMFQGSVEHCMIGVQILSQLTCEMNQPEVDVNISYIKHRKTVYSFRDTQLYDIYILSCTLLMTARDNCKTLNFMDEKQNGFVHPNGSLHFVRFRSNHNSILQTRQSNITFNQELLELRFHWHIKRRNVG